VEAIIMPMKQLKSVVHQQ